MIRVRKPGLQPTVQALGRPGFGLLGVSAGGAADAHALRLGNLLLGNEEGAAALEGTLLGPTLVFEEAALFVLAGASFDAFLEGKPARAWEAHAARSGATLRVGPTRSGARVLVCVAGGIALPAVLGSASTDLSGRFGGVRGRPLVEGASLATGRAGKDPRGAVQGPADGQPIGLFGDQQTTGGYPKIAGVVTADRSALAQLRPRDEVRFRRVTFGEAREALLDQERRLASGEAFLP